MYKYDDFNVCKDYKIYVQHQRYAVVLKTGGRLNDKCMV